MLIRRGRGSNRWWAYGALLALVGGVALGPDTSGSADRASVFDAAVLGALIPGVAAVAAAPAEQGACSPRPPVRVTTTGDAAARVLNVTIAAGLGLVQQIQFTNPWNAIVTVPGHPPIAGSATVAPNLPAVAFTVQQANGQAPVHVGMLVIDGCGEWRTFVGGGASWWAPQPSGGATVFRDQFAGTQAPPLPPSLPASPGPGSWKVTDVEVQLRKLGGRLRGLTQPASPVWGDAKVVGPGFIRFGGRAYATVVTLQDQNAPLVAGWDVAVNGTPDPRSVGHSIVFDTSNLGVSVPGREVLVNLRTGATGASARPLQYLLVVVLGDVGATYWISTFGPMTGGLEGDGDQIGISTWPRLRLLWVDAGAAAGTSGTLYPIVSGHLDGNGPMPPYAYVNGHGGDDQRWCDRPQASADREGGADCANPTPRPVHECLPRPESAGTRVTQRFVPNHASETSMPRRKGHPTGSANVSPRPCHAAQSGNGGHGSSYCHRESTHDAGQPDQEPISPLRVCWSKRDPQSPA